MPLNWIDKIMIYIKCFVILLFALVETKRHIWDKKNMFTIEVKGNYTEEILTDLGSQKFRLLHKITPSVYIFKYHGQKNTYEVLTFVRETFPNQVVDIEPIRVYNDTYKPRQTPQDNQKLTNSNNLVCGHYYGMGVHDVWNRNITGKGVTIAVNDVGINTDLHDLRRNIGNCSFCKNFINNSTDTTPESFKETLEKEPRYVDHGNNIAGVAAAEKNNNFCSAGIAYDATIIALKIHEVVIKNHIIGIENHRTSSDVMSRSFSYELDKIDIFINAWAPNLVFHKLDLSTRKAIINGAIKGRNGLGTIYVVAAGASGYELSNNIHTISVNSIGINGSRPYDAYLDSSVLTCGLDQGNNISSPFMVTTSHDNKCVTHFKGGSLAVSQVSGIIALGLQANPNLTLRDVQHLLVKASSHEHLKETLSFRRNGASLYFHEYFGFGLLNANKFVLLALNFTSIPLLHSININKNTRRPNTRTQDFEFPYTCDSDKICLTSIEHVNISINFTTTTTNLELQVTSPMETESRIMELDDIKEIPYKNEGSLITAHFWDENPQGKWIVTIQNKYVQDKTDIHGISLTLYGTARGDKDDSREETKAKHRDHHHYIYIWIPAVVGVLLVILGVVAWCLWKKRISSTRREHEEIDLDPAGNCP